MDGWMLGKCCLFGVSDLFLICFWPFPESSSTSKKSARAIKLGTILAIVKVISLLVPEILVVVVVVEVVVVIAVVVVVIVVVVIVEVAMIRAEVDGWMDARQVLPFWCFWPVSDLFLTFPGVFFNFKKISTGNQTRNNFSDRQSNIITGTRNTSTSATSSSSSSRRSSSSSSTSSSSSSSSTSSSSSHLRSSKLTRMSFWPYNICADSARAESARPCQLLAWF